MIPVPDRLVPLYTEQRQRKVKTVFAVLAAVLFILAALNVHVGALSPFDLACLAGAALSLHFAAGSVWSRA